MKSILSLIEKNSLKYPNSIAVADDNNEFTYKEMISNAKSIATLICSKGLKNKPIAIYINKSADLAVAMLSVMYSGNFYTVIDTEMPVDRIQSIFETLNPAAIITDASHMKNAKDIEENLPIIEYSQENCNIKIDNALLNKARKKMVSTDPMYILYTSGSTGRPKGTVISHGAVMAYIEWAVSEFDFNNETVFGSQTPFYFSMSVTDLFSALTVGGRLQIIPQNMFSFPLMLIEYMNKKKINTIYWVPSALCLVANWDTFSYAKPEYLQKILFAGESMPVKQLNYWMKNLSEPIYANLFGPTETTDICSFYVVDRDFEDNELLPIGKACDNCKLIILDEKGNESKRGELYVGGPFLANGYYNDPQKTKNAFILNPLNKNFPEKLYKTGDLVKLGKDGNILYLGRKDTQIKHMGYRIELGEIEAAANAVNDIKSTAVIYDDDNDKIVLIYTGSANNQEIVSFLSEKVPSYMMPNKIIKIKNMPHNQNGKIDRKYLKQNLKLL